MVTTDWKRKMLCSRYWYTADSYFVVCVEVRLAHMWRCGVLMRGDHTCGPSSFKLIWSVITCGVCMCCTVQHRFHITKHKTCYRHGAAVLLVWFPGAATEPELLFGTFGSLLGWDDGMGREGGWDATAAFKLLFLIALALRGMAVEGHNDWGFSLG